MPKYTDNLIKHRVYGKKMHVESQVRQGKELFANSWECPLECHFFDSSQ